MSTPATVPALINVHDYKDHEMYWEIFIFDVNKVSMAEMRAAGISFSDPDSPGPWEWHARVYRKNNNELVDEKGGKGDDENAVRIASQEFVLSVMGPPPAKKAGSGHLAGEE